MNRREILIETLHGDVSKFRELPEQIKQVGIFDDETGCVDHELMFAILNLASTLETVTAQLVGTLNELLGPDPEPVNKKPKDKGGADWTVEKILSECVLEDNIMRLPQVQFNKKRYLEVKNRILEAGGQWNGQLNGFTFDFDAKRVFELLKSGKRCNLQQEFQYFATPDNIADIAYSGSVNQYVSHSNLAAHLRTLRGKLQHISAGEDPDPVLGKSQVSCDLGLGHQVLVLSVNGHGELRLYKAVYKLYLLLACMSGDMYILKDNIDSLLKELVDYPGNGLLISRNGVG